MAAIALEHGINVNLLFKWRRQDAARSAKAMTNMVAALEHPMCITGQGACPPEDVGGVPGYEQFVQAMADPANPEHDELMRWHGGPFDRAAFSAAEVQERLDGFKL